MSDLNATLEARLRADLERLPAGSRSDIAPVLAKDPDRWSEAERAVAQRMCDWLDVVKGA